MIQLTRHTFNAAKIKNDLKIIIFLLCDIPLITAYYYDNIMRQHLRV